MQTRWRRTLAVVLLSAGIGFGLYVLNYIAHPLGWPFERPGYWSVVSHLLHETRFICEIDFSLGAFLYGLIYVVWTVAWAVFALHLWRKLAGTNRWYIVMMLLLALAVVLPVFPTSRTICPQM
ncbi:hypothetical protein F0U59_24235 [Archangium gephyra]|nr:hypothetical protein F0U59_24235 [Archangium gephyra]